MPDAVGFEAPSLFLHARPTPDLRAVYLSGPTLRTFGALQQQLTSWKVQPPADPRAAARAQTGTIQWGGGGPSPRPARVPAEINRRWIGVRRGRGRSRERGERMLVRRGGHAGPGDPASRAPKRGLGRPGVTATCRPPRPPAPRAPHAPQPAAAAHARPRPFAFTPPSHAPRSAHVSPPRQVVPPRAEAAALAGAHGSDAHSPRPSLARRDGRRLRLRLRRLPQQRPGQPERERRARRTDCLDSGDPACERGEPEPEPAEPPGAETDGRADQ